MLSAALVLAAALPALARVTVTDLAGRQASFEAPPTRIVSLVPAVTESLYALGAGDAVKGTTIFFDTPYGHRPPPEVGGFFAPSLAAILAQKPQVVITGAMHAKLEKELTAQGITPLRLQARRLDDLYTSLEILGQLLDKRKQAQEVTARLRGHMKRIAAKAAKLPPKARRRTTRVMGVDPKKNLVYIPGDDSFQNDMIAAAGGIPPKVGKKGGSVALTLAEWQKLNPQMAYWCGDKQKVRRFLNQAGWREVEAVEKQRLQHMPCVLTCRAWVHSDAFVAWLSALIYGDYYSQGKYQISPPEVISRRPLKIGLDYLASAEVVEERLTDFTQKTLLIKLKQPCGVLSTLEGPRQGISWVGNHYLPPPTWLLGGHGGLAGLRSRVLGVLGLEAGSASLLYTGADMANLAVKRASLDGRTAYALVTAGVRGNALRLAAESKGHLGPGTINILILTNRRLTPRAMARALITATEAKTAALEDLDVRSSYAPLKYAATGTGTDNILVVQGQGPVEKLTGGHSPMGGLIALAVRAGVLEAVERQNRLRAGRSVFKRLQERRVSLYALAGYQGGSCPSGGVPLERLEETLLNPRYAALVEAALSLSDAAARGQAEDLGAFQTWCQAVAKELAGKHPLAPAPKLGGPPLPRPLAMALGAIVQGLASEPRPLIPVSGAECGS
ncbi:MAG: adenosylcobinamide amidohydrolase [Desulfarculaceae bacterium]|nr:adenosylcobinamide amidohydrolase [Desulfarculaceae bacterium]MCF8072046.1 adenosylcobinamide amidohydrolase [Desulfarculaceae bacterium]MCF8101563.1 adenosylcobinamide amidohydrolase [Desulfarculaceae bacterium]MCF8115113.1 adenosylcobinamide amidohydrolase [Desulfarculaceae bacterium]